MKKKILAWIFVFVGILSLASCTGESGVITKVSEEAEYTKIENNITEVYETVSKGCVGILVSNDSSSATGSGVIYKYDESKSMYYVVTNAHVVEDMTSCKVYMGGTKYNSATILGYDSKNDIGVVTFTLDLLNMDMKDKLYVNDFFNYEDNDLPAVGQTVLAIGCPLGLDNYNVLTTGVVSSVSKSQISLDAAINPGNSGGGLFNLAGRLIGINTEKEVWTISVSDSGLEEKIPVEGRGYAISLSVVKNCINAIVEKNGVVERPLLGITVATVNTVINPNSDYIAYLPQTDDIVYFIVTDFNNEPSNPSAALRAGIMTHDVLLEINGSKITSASDISDVLNSITMEDTITLKVYRITGNQPTTKEITVSFQ